MVTSLSLIFLVGLSLAAVCEKIHLPRIIGMMVSGILLGPFVLDWLDPQILGISSQLRQMALCLIGTSLNIRERFFCVIAYLPKATVQAAIGSVPLSMGLPCGSIVLSVAVLGILITAPLGALGIDLSCKKLLKSIAELSDGTNDIQ